MKSEAVFRKPAEGFLPNPLLKWGDNLPCSCGSNVKFKKCCKSRLPALLPKLEAQEVARLIKAVKQSGSDLAELLQTEVNPNEIKTT